MNALLSSIHIPDYRQFDPWTDEALSLWVPIVAYWVYSIAFQFLMMAEIPFIEKYRIHTPDDMRKRNRVTFGRVVVMVIAQQIVQVILGLMFIAGPDPEVLRVRQENAVLRIASHAYHLLSHLGIQDAVMLADGFGRFTYFVARPCAQFVAAMVIMDTHQYFLHRLFHLNKFFYKHIHSHHHRLYVPYAFGALYNHPIEGFLLDTVGATLSYELTGMSPRMGMLFFTFSNMKTVDDHCGYSFPWDPLQALFGNNVVYHDIHHQPYGIKKNFSQPYFTFWDTLLGTRYTKSVKKEEAKSQ